MKKRVVLSLLSFLVLLAGVAAAWMVRGWQDRSPEWTTRSPAAAEQLDLALENMAKVYIPEMRKHLTRALELDPDFAAAKLFLATFSPADENLGLREELGRLDLTGLTPRERFLIEYRTLRWQGEPEKAQAVLEAFRQAHPDDVYGLETTCGEAFLRRETETARACYQELLRHDPNWVRGENFLGYLAMAEGRFDDAEEHFLTYRFIAPDQANPYDSRGELLMVVGRWEEAEESLRKALELRPDFCFSREHLTRLYLISGRFDDALDVITEMEQICPQHAESGWICEGRGDIAYLRGDWSQAREILDETCMEKVRWLDSTAFRIALRAGDEERARKIEQAAEEDLQRALDLGQNPDLMESRIDLLQGLRSFDAEDWEAAAQSFRAAESALDYYGGFTALPKLFTRMHLQTALVLAGEEDEARRVADEISAVNPHLLDSLSWPDLEEALRKHGGAVR